MSAPDLDTEERGELDLLCESSDAKVRLLASLLRRVIHAMEHEDDYQREQAEMD